MSNPTLFKPIRIGNLELDNRIIVAPMSQYSAENGCMTDWHLVHLGHLAISGAALLTIEATSVLQEGRITYADVAIGAKRRGASDAGQGKQSNADFFARKWASGSGRRLDRVGQRTNFSGGSHGSDPPGNGEQPKSESAIGQ